MELEDTHFKPEGGPANVGGYEGETEAQRKLRLHPEEAILEQTIETLWEKLGADGVEMLFRVHNYDPDNPQQRDEDRIYRALHERLAKDQTQRKNKKQ
ncbi:MAG: hypothetical protein VE98_C0001G0032 [candidate division Kazan bacterium GW2011_GWA1_50_15]|uniref:Uncharacterized protein n=2 Tax=Bacteria division Kazan-3B-28 TaxID=1798534 RepID=A0A0G1X829_UNCK3|nr:MAG: hypothetical protein VE98_C0001G0032 [candidate division Kazan bacterium GW2011_GWA1_50_15]KKW25685.1 MAG: hypothetical protein VE99_C0001G0324 [candidate division Kazan bacterium GW2011_GWC1_52_13]KKW26990.1 MAG: hypothetical protein VF00_C0002G0317 [candidate division Kazan bacterium GW2011_GWB1_52_7]HAV66022.1 hypothetical protein [Patescibacteria group bacterium]HCR42591.1 hypothetical protein [Patescibacteria group bacterium]